ncbi:ankyrin repeat-containing protein 3 [Elsinoe australis]|uniref:Ankyrin repeat-containing protein 3 n=1 Tax=Elsinoe australis TaxID=40998 RepID=A0A4U7BAG0_9PEZI|nr:ankyrin repeat-containing protein 3 [Elsinoe australis]
MQATSAADSRLILGTLEPSNDVNEQDVDGNTSLHHAMRHTDDEQRILITKLLASGADPNLRNNQGETPLHLLEHWSNTAELLLDHGADIEAKDAKGRAWLFRLLERAERNFMDDCRECLNFGASGYTRDAGGRSLLHALIAVQSDPASKDAAWNLLTEAGLDAKAMDHEGNTLLHEAVSVPFQDFAQVGRLISLGLDIDQPNLRGQSSVHVLCSMGRMSERPYAGRSDDLMEYMLRTTKNINAPDAQGVTPLLLACTVSENTVVHLLRAGACSTSRTFAGMNCLHLAARSRQTNIIGLILNHLKFRGAIARQALLNAKDSTGKTPLHYACRSGRPESVALLIDAGADIIAQDYKSHTPLWLCLEFETEQHLWSDYRETRVEDDRYLQQWEGRPDLVGQISGAAGLSPDDGSRPFVSVGKEITSLLGSTCVLRHEHESTRLEEIFDLIMERAKATGISESELGLPSTAEIAEFGKRGHYCVARSFCSLKYPDWTIAGMFHGPNQDSLSIVKARFEAMTAALCSMVTDKSQLYLYTEMVHHKEFSLLTELLESGKVVFDSKDMEHHRFLELLAKFGYARLLGQVGKKILVGDSQRPGMRQLGAAERRNMRRNLHPLLYTACRRELPNMDVVRILIEEIRVDINEFVYDRMANEDLDANEEMRDDARQSYFTSLHYLAMGQHWWQVAHCLPYLFQVSTVDVNC